MKPKPVHVARCGAVTVKVHRNGPDRFCIAWRQFAGAPRKRETFGVKKDAIARADEIAKAVADGQAESVKLTGVDRESWRRIVTLCAPLGVQPVALVEEAVAARAILPPGETLHSVVLAHGRALKARAIICPPTSEIVAALVARARSDGRSGDRYIAPLKCDLERFAKVAPRLDQASEDDVRAYLAGLVTKQASKQRGRGEPVSARRRDNVLASISTLFRFAVSRRWVEEDVTEGIAYQSRGTVVSTYTGAQLGEVLGYFAEHDREWLPWAALCALGGLRTSEVERLHWSAINWPTSSIAVPANVALKIQRPRTAPLLPSLAEWLAPWRTASGPVIPPSPVRFYKRQTHALRRMTEAIGWERWDTNALRHSFGSHRLAVVKDFARVAYEMGNSVPQLRNWYYDAKTEAAATAYFSVLPPWTASNVTPMPIAQ